jgi:hypothetical protein
MSNGNKSHQLKDPTLKELKNLLNQKGSNLSLPFHGKKLNLIFLYLFVTQILLAVCLLLYLL